MEKAKNNGILAGIGMIGFGLFEGIASGGILCPLCIISGVTGIKLIKDSLKH